MRGDVPAEVADAIKRNRFSPHTRGCSALLALVFGFAYVFPACAGMFLFGQRHILVTVGFPRMRGDVPSGPLPRSKARTFSPHARGCSRGQSAHKVCALSFPRMRGDVPHGALTKAATQAFSPHARGCSSCVKPQWYKVRVFPACAGMFHCLNPQLPSSFRFPRMRGDVPLAAGATRTVVVFSPHARGCSAGKTSGFR